ncbi:MAG: hypothetical protein Q8R91_04560 [Candidatus Omnitrophota bacterium]|nr:hypothetical protein [Candidatus Omnitrophota bacterium]
MHAMIPPPAGGGATMVLCSHTWLRRSARRLASIAVHLIVGWPSASGGHRQVGG